jgi:hypothetical protein
VKNSNVSAKDVYATDMEHHTQTWKSVLIMKENLWKNNINFVKDIPIKYINFNVTVIIFSDEKIGNIIFIPNFVIFINTGGGGGNSSQLKTAVGLKAILIL